MGHYDDEPEWYLKDNWISMGVSNDRNKIWKSVKKEIETKYPIKEEYKKLGVIAAQLKRQQAVIDKIENQIHQEISRAVDKIVKEKYGGETSHRLIHERSWRNR